jgi:hypothetical protein
MSLPPIPDGLIDAAGQPRFGVYAGAFEAIDWGGVGRGRLYRLGHHKRWWYVCAGNREVFAAFAMVDLGYVANGFAYAVDLATGKLLADRSLLGAPGLQIGIGAQPLAGARGRFRGPGTEIALERPDAASPYRFQARIGRMRADFTLDPRGSTPLTLVFPIGGGGAANCTTKLAALPVDGELTVDGRRFRLDGGDDAALGGLDYTNGLLARETSWRWAFGFGRDAAGRALAWNFVEGFSADPSGPSENAIWLGGRPHPVHDVSFRWSERDPLAPWRIVSADGAVDLTFAPLAGHFERRDLLVARAHFVQPAGHFTGTLRVGGETVAIAGLPGVVEDQRVKW